MKELNEVLKNNREIILVLASVSGVLLLLSACVLIAEIAKAFINNCG